MKAVLTIASLMLREAVRRRLVAAFALISIVLVGVSGWGFYKLSHGTGFTSGVTNLALPQAVVLLEFMFSFVVALSASAVASLAVSGEIDSGVLQAVVARPVRRSEVLLGKWLGLVGLLAAYTAIVNGLQVAVVYWATGFVPPDPAAAAAFVFTEGVVLLTLVLLISTRLPALAAGVIGVALFGVAWLAGVAGTLGAAFNIHAMHTASEISQYLLPTDGLWHGAMYSLEPTSFLTQQLAASPVGQGDPFLALNAPPWQYLVWTAIWLAGVLTLGLVSFARREL
jgi:ABC-type transport system involved in multi-copper enzyme maturation permease subunit